RHDRHVARVAAVALRQGGTWWIRRRLHQLSAHARAIPRLRRRLARRRQGRLPRLGDALLRRLLAHRGDGRARPRHLAPWADEAVRPHQSARPRDQALCRRSAAPGQSAWHPVQHGGLPDQAQARRADALLPHHPGSRAGRVRAPRRPSPQHLPERAQAPRWRFAAQCRAAPALCRSDHRLRGLRGIRRHRAHRGSLRGRRTAQPLSHAAAADHGAWRVARAYHRRPCGNRLRRRTGRRALVPADERQFRPLSAARARGQARKRTALARHRKGAGKKARAHSPRARRPRALDHRRRSRRRGGITPMGLPREIEERWTSGVVLKRDLLSTVERGRFGTRAGDVDAVLRRIDEVPWWSFGVARHLFAREQRALAIAGELGIAPPLLFAGRDALIRGWIDGLPLHIAKPRGERNFFRSAKATLRKLHRAGICHNDLAKEQNWLRGRDGRAYVTDFQLAARFSRRSWLFRIAAYEDLRHLLKHNRRYAPEALTAAEHRVLARKSLPTRVWMARGKKLYYLITRDVLRVTDREGGGTRFLYDAPRIAGRLKAHPQVREAVVVAFPDRRSGTGLYAFVGGDAALTEHGLREFLAEPASKAATKPPEYLQGASALPRRVSGDVRREILELVAMNQVDLIETLIATDDERSLVARIVADRRNLRDRFAF